MKKTNEQPEQSLREGDHLVSSRLGYDHYAIYVGGNAVIHYADFADGIGSDGEISLATLKEFRIGSDVQVELHPLGSLNRQTIVERAYSRLGENWYNVFLNNCEHFANWCVRGTHSSPHLNALIGKAALAYGMQGTRGQKKRTDRFPSCCDERRLHRHKRDHAFLVDRQLGGYRHPAGRWDAGLL